MLYFFSSKQYYFSQSSFLFLVQHHKFEKKHLQAFSVSFLHQGENIRPSVQISVNVIESTVVSRMSKLEKLLDFLSSKLEYEERYAAAKASTTCIKCGKLAQQFRDESARLEYSISALCQKCQDEFFNGGGLRR